MVDSGFGTIEAERLASSRLVVMTGEHDLSTAAAVADAFQHGEPGTATIVDLTGATFIDSSVIGVLAAAARGETVLLVVPRDSTIRRTLEIFGINTWLQTFETRSEALNAVSAEDARAVARPDE